jgi:sulfite reductase alpha subunit-like flavoprotein
MVALGTGISPMLAMIRQRARTEGKLGPAYLFFGARNAGAFARVLGAMEGFIESKKLSNMFTAFSRDGGKPKHVQDLMKEKADILWDLWQDPKTQFFYCGPRRGIPDELKEFMLQMTITEGWLSREEAMAFNSRHEWLIEAA